MQQRVFFIRITRDAILAAARRIDEFDFDSGSNTGNVAIKPVLERISRGRTAAFVRLALVRCRPTGVFPSVRLAVHDVDAAAIGLPAGNA